MLHILNYLCIHSLQDGRTALYTASFNGHAKVVEHLLAAGANPDLQKKVNEVSTVNRLSQSYIWCKLFLIINKQEICINLLHPIAAKHTCKISCPLTLIAAKFTHTLFPLFIAIAAHFWTCSQLLRATGSQSKHNQLWCPIGTSPQNHI